MTAAGFAKTVESEHIPVKQAELFVERVILASRWLLIIFLMGLAVALGIYAVSFTFKLYKIASSIFVFDEADMILAMLGLIDAALVASLLVMVMIASYENFIGRFDDVDTELSWLGKVDSGSLKIKVASSIVAISSIHLLQIFLNADKYTDSKIMWFTIMHMAFVFSALLLGLLDRMMAKPK